MIADFMDLAFGCTHSQYSWPQKTKDYHAMSGHYVVCTACGTELFYDLRLMKVSHKLSKRYDSQPDQYTGNLITDLTEQVERMR
jgi:hypothetical protein